MIVFIKPHKLEKFMWLPFVGTVGTVFGIMGWAVSKNGGSAGNLVAPAIALTASRRGFIFVQAISTICGTYGAAADRFADVSLRIQDLPRFASVREMAMSRASKLFTELEMF